jgi:hypothetical protein
MNCLVIQSSVWAMVIILTISGRPALRSEPGQANSSQKTQQDQDKQQKKDKTGSNDNSQPKNAKTDDAAKNGDKPAPLFGGSLSVKSSRQTKDSATLGFNGVDDNGQVQKSFLSATASGPDTSAVQKMANTSVSNTELDEFIQQGGLNANPAAKKSSNSGAKQ